MEYNSIRRKSKEVHVGSVTVGGQAPVSVQSMTNTDPHDYEKTLAQIEALAAAGCDIVRLAIPDKEAVSVLSRLKEKDNLPPLVADIHFNASLAVMAAEAGADKIRINPGNIGSADRVKEVVTACKKRGIPIRVGVNSGSLEKELLQKYGAPTAEALAESALANVRRLERFDFTDIVVAVKASDVKRMTEAVKLIAERCPYPLHLGVTEAGSESLGSIKNAIGIGHLLLSGIGDTLRVSLTADPVKEVQKGREILAALGMDDRRPIDLVSCPTCGRTKLDLEGVAAAFEARIGELHPPKRLKVAIMGCAVNGPGEAADADVGIAGGVKEALLFSHGKVLRMIPQEAIVDTLIETINHFDKL